MKTDAEIIHLVLSGHSEVFGELVSRYGNFIHRVCARFIKNEHGVQDAVQDTFVRAFVNLKQVKEPKQLGGWLRQVACSVCMNRLKGQGKEFTLASVDDEEGSPFDPVDHRPEPGREAENRELINAVLRNIAELPTEYREPIEMFYFKGKTPKDIAMRLGLNPGCVRTRLHRAHQLLKSHLSDYRSVEIISRNKEGRYWLPSNLSREEANMTLQYTQTKRRLRRGDTEVKIRMMTREDIPAMRRFDQELTAVLDDRNAQLPPEKASYPGGPWSNDAWLLEHFNKYAERGNLTLLAEDGSGKLVGFADLWATEEPEPFGRSINVECIDYFYEYYPLGLEVVLLEEAEKIACGAGVPALDIGTNTCSGDYPVLRRFGMKVFYEYDNVLCRCRKVPGKRRCKHKTFGPDLSRLKGLIKVNHWSPTDFTFRGEKEKTLIIELSRPKNRAIVEFWRLEPNPQNDNPPVPPNIPTKSELFVTPQSLNSTEIMNDILEECTQLAGEAGAEVIQLPCPSNIRLDPEKVDVIGREFAFAWLRKTL